MTRHSNDLVRMAELERVIGTDARNIRRRIGKGLIRVRERYGVKLYSIKEAKKAFGLL